MLYTIDTVFGDIEDKQILDLGCGGGILGIGAAILGSSHVVGLDVDADALELSGENCENVEVEMDLLRANALSPPFPVGDLWNGPFDSVIMNPPFGTRTKGMDTAFLHTALRSARSSVYSLHKRSTRGHFERKAQEWGIDMQVVAELRWDLPKSYNFHSKRSVDIEVDFLRFSPSSRKIQKRK